MSMIQNNRKGTWKITWKLGLCKGHTHELCTELFNLTMACKEWKNGKEYGNYCARFWR